jgi:hypothetical protein
MANSSCTRPIHNREALNPFGHRANRSDPDAKGGASGVLSRRAMRISPLSFCAPSFYLAIASCGGPWAQATHVLIAPLPGSKLSAQANVVEATTCVANRCQPREGSTIILTVTHAEPSGTYEAALATGSCQRPTDQRVLARFVGSDGTQTHVGIPVVLLTSGRYVLVLRAVNTPQSPGGCGVIKRAWPW